MSDQLKVKVYPYTRGSMGSMGNIIWAERDLGSSYYRVSKYAMRGGKFPPVHPVGGSSSDPGNELGTGENIKAFRARGYWASCFPEGDGITFEPLRDQTNEQCMIDIRECFGFDATWGREP